MVLTASSPGPVSGEDAQRAAREELSKVMYHRDDPSIVDRAYNWIGDRLHHLVDGSVSGAVLLLVALTLLGLVIFAVVRAGRPRREARLRRDGDPLAPSGGIDHRLRAEQFTAEGRRAEAVREWLRAAVASIEGRGVLDPRPGRTGTEIARAAGQVLPEAAGSLAAATLAFDQIWFGERGATDADVAVSRAAADAVRAAPIVRPDRVDAGFAVPR